MGLCLPKSPTCHDVNPNTKLFNVCCGEQLTIEHSEIDGVNEEEKHCDEQNKKVESEKTATLAFL